MNNSIIYTTINTITEELHELQRVIDLYSIDMSDDEILHISTKLRSILNDIKMMKYE